MITAETLAKWAIRLYALGIALCIPMSYPFFLTSYGSGGVPEFRGRMSGAFEDYFPEGADYMLFNHGRITLISKDYYDHIAWAKEFEGRIYIAGLPFLVAGLLGYCYRTKRQKGDWRIKLWLALFFPRKDDPFLTITAKLWFVLAFLALIVFVCPPDHESAFIAYVWAMYVVTAVLALACALVLRWAFAFSTSSDSAMPNQRMQRVNRFPLRSASQDRGGQG